MIITGFFGMSGKLSVSAGSSNLMATLWGPGPNLCAGSEKREYY